MTTSVVSMPLLARLKSISGFLGIRLKEEPKYFVLLKEENFQVRKYHPFVMAQTFIRGDFNFSANEGFYRLTNYIYGANSEGEKMSMASPMLQSKNKKLVMVAPVLHEQKSDGWVMSFIIPSKYKFENLPRPTESTIEIVKVPSLIVASIRYSGKNTEQKINEKSRELITWLETKDYNILSEPRCALYDSPHVFSYFRRNEIQITVQEGEKKKRQLH